MDSNRGSARPIVFVALAIAVLGALGYVMFVGTDDDAFAEPEALATTSLGVEFEAPKVDDTTLDASERAEQPSEAIAESTDPVSVENAIPADSTGVKGRVIGRDGKPAADVEVTMWRVVAKKQLTKYGLTADPGKDTARYLKTARTDAEGRFVLIELIADSGYGLRVRGDEGLLGRKDNVEVIEKFVFDLGDVPLKRGAIVSGVVRNEGGAPIGSAEISFDWGLSDKPCVADSQGRFRSDVLLPGKRQVRVKAKGYALRELIQRELIEGDVIDDFDIEMVKAEPIRGRVVDVSGRGVVGAYVNCNREQDEMSMFGWYGDNLQSGPGGDFVFDSLPAGKYQVSCNLVGYRGSSQEGILAGGDPVELKLTRVASIEGRVFDAATNAPVKADSVRLQFIPPNAKGNATFRPYWRGVEVDVDEVGKYKVTLNEGGQFKVIVSADGYRPSESAPFQLTENAQMSGIDVRLEKGQELELVVVDKVSRAPVPGAIVRVFEGGGTAGNSMNAMNLIGYGSGPGMSFGGGSRSTGVGRSISDAEGIARVKSMYTGKFNARAEHANFAPTKLDPIEIREGAPTTRLEIEMTLGGSIEGAVTNDKKVPEPATTVYAVSKERRTEGVTDADGKYSIAHLPAGRYRIETEITSGENTWFQGSFDGDQEQTEEQKFPLVVEEGKATRHDVTITRIAPGSLVGTVLLNGVPAPGVMVMTMRKNEKNGEFDWNTQSQSKTDSQGRFKFRSLKPGTYGISSGPSWEKQYALGTAEIASAQEANVVFDVPLGSMRIRVVDQDGKPVAGAWINLERTQAEAEFNPWGGGRWMESDASGELLLEHLQAGEYTLDGSKQGYRQVQLEKLVVTARREAGPVEVKLVTGGWIELKITGLERLGEGVRIRVNLQDEAGDVTQSNSLWNQNNGVFWIDANQTPRGVLKLFARPQGQSNNVEIASTPFVIEAGKNLELPIVLQ